MLSQSLATSPVSNIIYHKGASRPSHAQGFLLGFSMESAFGAGKSRPPTMPVVRMEPPLATDSARASSASAVASSQRSGDNNLEDQSGGRRRTEQEEDALMNEMLSKHRSELQKFIGRAALVRDGDDDDDDDDDHDASHFSDAESPPPPPPPLTASANSGDFHSETYVELPSPDGFSTPRPVRSKTAERLLELSRTEEAARTDRMRLADLSDVRNERLGREVISRWNPEAKVKTHRPHALATTSPRPSAKLLGYSKDFVQQALDFNGHDMDEDDDDALALAGVDVHDGGGQEEVEEEEHFRGGQSQVELRRYVKQMEATIAQLVQQKDELLRNQAEFDKHASGIFPSLEHLNHQLSQIVQGKMATSQVNIKVRGYACVSKGDTDKRGESGPSEELTRLHSLGRAGGRL